MARCGCVGGCSCTILVEDTASINMTITGDGTVATPYLITAVNSGGSEDFITLRITAEDEQTTASLISDTTGFFYAFDEFTLYTETVNLNLLTLAPDEGFNFYVDLGQISDTYTFTISVWVSGTIPPCDESFNYFVFSGTIGPTDSYTSFVFLPEEIIDSETTGTDLSSFLVGNDFQIVSEDGGCYMAQMLFEANNNTIG